MKKSVVAKRVRAIYDARAAYIATGRPSDIPLCVTAKNAKFTALNVALAPVIDCNNCAGCGPICYDVVHACFRPSVVDARARNSAIYAMDPAVFFSKLADAIDARNAKKVRLLESGDAPSRDFFDGVQDLAAHRPDVRFWGYTKNFRDLDSFERDHGGRPFADIVPGVHILRSHVPGCRFSNPYGDPVADIQLKGQPAPAGALCPGHGCDTCPLCPYGKSVYFRQH